MKKEKDKIEQFLKKVRTRLTEQLMIDNLLAFLAAGFAVGLVLSVISMIVPFFQAAIWSMAVLVICMIAAGIWTRKKRPTLTQAALYVDALGYKEIFVTAYTERENTSVFVKLVQKQAEKVIDEFPVRKRLPLVIRWKRAGAFLFLAAVFLISMLIETDARSQARYEHHVSEKAQTEISEIEKIEKDVKQADASGKETEELLSALEQAKEELAEAKSYEDVQKVMDRATFKMSEAAQSENQTLSQTLSEAAAKHNEQKNADIETLSKEVQKALEKAENGTKKEKTEAAEKLSELSALLSDSELADAAETYAESDRTSADARTAAKAASEATAKKLASNSEESHQKTGTIGQDGTKTNDNSGNGSGSEGSSAEGTSEQNNGGNGTGAGSGNNGSGTGDGSGNNGTGSGGGSGSGSGWNRGSKETVERENNTVEQVTIPEGELGSDGNLTGKETTDGQTSYESSDQSLAWSGNKVSYGQVSGAYKEKAYSALESATYPDSMKDKIKNYFDGLE